MNVSAKGNSSKLNNFASGACWFCEQKTHRLAKCQKFRAEPVEKRFTFVKSSKLCHKCLSPKHRTPECKRKKPCEKCDCAKSFHHTLLHFPKSESKGKSSTGDVGTLLQSVKRWEPFPQHVSINFPDLSCISALFPLS